MWDNSKFQGKILGVPLPSTRSGNVPFYRGDWLESLGLAEPTSIDELNALLAAMTNDDPDGNGQQDTWGQGRYQGGWEAFDNQLVHRMFKVPNGWRLNDDGTLIAAQETDEYRQALETITQLYADGTFHPDASGMTFSDAQNAYIAGETGFHCEGFGSFFGRGSVTFRIQEINPDAYTTGYIPKAADGSGLGVVNNNIGFFGMNAIPSSIQDEERVLELLRILDYLAAPFGSEEEVFLSNGIEGVHHEVQDNGARIQTDEGRTQIADLTYQMGPLNVFYYPEEPELALQVQDLAKQAAEIGQDNPTWGLYSPTDVQEGPVLSQFSTDTTLAIITGQESMDRLDSAIEEWRSRGGDQIRQEFEEALQQG
jgi:putative aldouronate transport system substrate-binding protein